MNKTTKMTIGRKAALAVAIPLLIGILILEGLQLSTLRAMVLDISINGQSSVVELMADRMAGGVKWGKAKIVEAVINDVAEKSDSELTNVVVLDMDNQIMVTYSSEKLTGDVNLRSIASELDPAGSRGSAVVKQMGTHVVIVASIGGDQPVGTLITAWNHSAINKRALDSTLNGAAYGLIILGLIVAIVTVFLARTVVKPITLMTDVTGRLASGDMTVQIPGGDRNDEIGEMARSLEQIRTVGVTAAQARSSLNDTSSPMMIVDLDGQVIFPNKAMNNLFGSLMEDLSKELDGFGNPVLAGLDFDTLHNVAAMRIDQLIALTEPASARMALAGRTIDLTASPVFNDAGDRLGTVVEWQDMTVHVAVEREIAGIVHSATEGDFSQRLSEADKTGFFADLAAGMNELLDVVDNGLDQVVKVVSALAEGDITRRMHGEHKGAFARLKDDADRMGDRMEEIVGRIAEVSGAVQTATDELSSGISDLSARTEHQASSLEETTASMEELSATVRQNADSAQEANQVATAAREVANNGGEIVERTVSAMSGIEASSRQINEIVGLIQEIAFQTNLLALNASVEAARAGEAGRGFAVVANEVRALAQRAASASKDIKELIVNSESQVQDGVRLVGEAGASLDEIVTSVKKVADYVSEIAAASHEQTSGIDQVSAAITGMDEMTQQNATLVEETTATIESAVGQVSALQQAVGFFRTAQTHAMPREADPDDQPAANPVHNQQKTLTRKLAASVPAAAVADDDWQEF